MSACSLQQDLFAQEYAQLGASSPEIFWPRVSDLTQRVIQTAKNQLSSLIPSDTLIAIATTGSDSRFEKAGLDSPLELIIISPTRESLPEETKNKVLSLLTNPLIFPDIEYVFLDTDRVGMFGNKKVIPTRALDAYFLAGNRDTFQAYKKQLFSEIQEKTIKLALFRKEFIRPALKAIEKTMSNSGGYIELQSGTVQYAQKGGRGIKHDLLRTVQYPLALALCYAVQQNKCSSEQFLSFPQTIQRRISWLRERGHISLTDEKTRALFSAYTQATIWYAQLNTLSQQKDGEPVKLSFPQESLQQAVQTIQTTMKEIS